MCTTGSLGTRMNGARVASTLMAPSTVFPREWSILFRANAWATVKSRLWRCGNACRHMTVKLQTEWGMGVCTDLFVFDRVFSLMTSARRWWISLPRSCWKSARWLCRRSSKQDLAAFHSSFDGWRRQFSVVVYSLTSVVSFPNRQHQSHLYNSFLSFFSNMATFIEIWWCAIVILLHRWLSLYWARSSFCLDDHVVSFFRIFLKGPQGIYAPPTHPQEPVRLNGRFFCDETHVTRRTSTASDTFRP